MYLSRVSKVIAHGEKIIHADTVARDVRDVSGTDHARLEC